MALVASVVETETMRMRPGSSMWMPSMTASMPMEKSRRGGQALVRCQHAPRVVFEQHAIGIGAAGVDAEDEGFVVFHHRRPVRAGLKPTPLPD
jgi:hypothetical protein